MFQATMQGNIILKIYFNLALSVSLLKWYVRRGFYFLTGTLMQSTALAEM